MGGSSDAPRRVRVERNIYRRPTGVLEVGFKDAAGIQRWRTVDGGIMAARKAFSPATKKSVFFETLEVALPPSCAIKPSISSRL